MSRTHDISSQLAIMFEPQFAQFDIELKRASVGWQGRAVAGGRGDGEGWVIPLSEHCIAIGHSVAPKTDMVLTEICPRPYACVSLCNSETVICSEDTGIPVHRVAPRGPWPGSNATDQLYSFVQHRTGEMESPLRAGVLYRSHTIAFLPGYFAELEQQWPREFRGLFDAFDSSWDEHAGAVMRTALRRVDPERALTCGAQLYMRASVDTMVAELASMRAEETRAQAAHETHRARRLAEEAAALAERALDEGVQLTVDDIAARLFVSRSRLSATFRAQTDETLGAYMRRRRIERAQELLAEDRLTVAQVASRLGYPQQSAFTQAFRHACGLSPTAWRDARG